MDATPEPCRSGTITVERKRCGRCLDIKPITEFNPKGKSGCQGYCKPCHAAWKKDYYQKHRAEYIERALAQKAKLRDVLRAAKNRPCQDCGKEYPPYVLDFDHREGEQKLFNVSSLNAHRWVSVRQLETEIAKCDLVCANCHRERTHQRRCRKGVRTND
jgi:hypothetical protein